MEYYKYYTASSTPDLGESTLEPFTLKQSFEHVKMVLDRSGAASEDITYDSEPASTAFLSGYLQCVGLYISYMVFHKEWKKSPERGLLRGMEWRPRTEEEYGVYKTICEMVSPIVEKLWLMNYTETEYMMGLGLLERFFEKVEDYELSSSTLTMTILVALITANKLSSDKAVWNAKYCQVFQVDKKMLYNSEIYFQDCGMSLMFSEEELLDLVKICEHGVKKV